MFISRALLGLGLVLAAGTAFAGTSPQTSSFGVTANVQRSCQIDSVTGISFGDYDVLSTTDATANGEIRIKCSTGVTNIRVALDQGLNADAGSTDAAPLRRMSSGSGFLPYNIYQDSGRSTVWGNTAASDVLIPGPTSAASVVSLTTYGKIAAGTDAPVGSYSDTVGVSVTF